MSVRAGTLRRAITDPEALSRYFRVLGDPTRLRIVEALVGRERTVSELVELLGAPQSRISNHLACLRWCRFVESERRGRSVVYRISDERVLPRRRERSASGRRSSSMGSWHRN